MIKTKRDGIKAAKIAVREYKNQASEMAKELEETKQTLAEVKQEAQEALQDLASGMLNSIDASEVARVAERANVPTLPGLLEKCETQREKNRERIARIESDSDFLVRSKLIGQPDGELTRKRRTLDAERTELEQSLVPFKFKPFQKLYRNQTHEPRNFGLAKKMGRLLTLAGLFETKAKEKVKAKFGGQSYESLVEYYETKLDLKTGLQKEIKTIKKRQDRIEGMVKEREDLTQAIEAYESRTLDRLLKALAENLKEKPFDRSYKTFGPTVSKCTARCHAIREKEKYLKEMIAFLKKEIADREKRVAGISQVLRKWQRNPGGFLRGDKTKWLKTVPEMKKTGTGKRLTGMRTVRTNIGGFNRYDRYHDRWDDDDCTFLAFDLFAWAAIERMPYDGFNRQILPSVERYREEHHQEKPDYGAFKEVDGHREQADADSGLVAAAAIGGAMIAAEVIQAEITEDAFDEAADLLGSEDDAAAMDEASEALAEEVIDGEVESDFGDSS